MTFHLTGIERVTLLAEISDPALREQVKDALVDARVTDVFGRAMGAVYRPAVGVAIAGSFAPAGTWGSAAQASALGIGGIAAVMDTANRNLLRRSLRSAEKACVLAGEFRAAALLRGQRVEMVAQVPGRRAAAGIACLDLIGYCTASGSPTLYSEVVGRSLETLTLFPSLRRWSFARAVRQANFRIADDLPVMERVMARTALIEMAEVARVEDIGELLIDAAADTFELGETAAVDGLGLAPTGSSETELLDGVLSRVMQATLTQAEALLATGLERILARSGSQRTDDLVRNLIQEDRLATRSVLDAYLRAMSRTEDARTAVFARLVGDGDPDNRAALAAIGLRGHSGPETLGR